MTDVAHVADLVAHRLPQGTVMGCYVKQTAALPLRCPAVGCETMSNSCIIASTEMNNGAHVAFLRLQSSLADVAPF